MNDVRTVSDVIAVGLLLLGAFLCLTATFGATSVVDSPPVTSPKPREARMPPGFIRASCAPAARV